MPIKKASWKSLRQSRVSFLRNTKRKATLKSNLKAAAKAISTKKTEAETAVKKAIQTVDRSIKKGLIKKNTGSRIKSQIVKKLNAALKNR